MNRRPSAPKADALPDCATPRFYEQGRILQYLPAKCDMLTAAVPRHKENASCQRACLAAFKASWTASTGTMRARKLYWPFAFFSAATILAICLVAPRVLRTLSLNVCAFAMAIYRNFLRLRSDARIPLFDFPMQRVLAQLRIKFLELQPLVRIATILRRGVPRRTRRFRTLERHLNPSSFRFSHDLSLGSRVPAHALPGHTHVRRARPSAAPLGERPEYPSC